MLPPLPIPNCAVILAGGEGKRMKSSRPKVLSPVLFKPMLRWVMDAALSAGLSDLCVVAGFQHEQVEDYLAQVCMEGLDLRLSVALQAERKGTAHAVQMANAFLESHRGANVLVLNGDAPFLSAETITGALEEHLDQENAVTVISAEIPNPTGYGRIVRDGQGAFQAIVEEKDASEEIRQIREVNSGAYWFRVDDLLSVLPRIGNQNAQGEYYLPDAVPLLLGDGKAANAFPAADPHTVLGANDCMQLHDLNQIARRQILERHMSNGVEIPCADGVVIGPDVTIGRDTCLLPGTVLRGDTQVGDGCQVGPNSYLIDTKVMDHLALVSVYAQNTVVSQAVPAYTSVGKPAVSHHHHGTRSL